MNIQHKIWLIEDGIFVGVVLLVGAVVYAISLVI